MKTTLSVSETLKNVWAAVKPSAVKYRRVLVLLCILAVPVMLAVVAFLKASMAAAITACAVALVVGVVVRPILLRGPLAKPLRATVNFLDPVAHEAGLDIRAELLERPWVLVDVLQDAEVVNAAFECQAADEADVAARREVLDSIPAPAVPLSDRSRLRQVAAVVNTDDVVDDPADSVDLDQIDEFAEPAN